MIWKPCAQEGVNQLALPLDPRQGYLLSLLDGTLDVPALSSVMNLGEDELTAMLSRLVAMGAVAPAIPTVQEAPEPEPAPEPPVPAEESGEDSSEAVARAATHRQLYAQHLQARPVELRVAQARAAVEPDLSAWCFDPMAEVIFAVLENPRVAPVHARLIAAHHRTTAGLEALGARPALVQDPGVRRALLQNPLLPVGLYRRLWSNKRLGEQYLVAVSREATEQVKAMARELLRASFNQRPGEERVELILTTEGRCLASLAGATLDSQATALMCRRTYISSLLIQNLARWTAAPPALIAHLRRQDIVKRNTVLRQLLERHPNAS